MGYYGCQKFVHIYSCFLIFAQNHILYSILNEEKAFDDIRKLFQTVAGMVMNREVKLRAYFVTVNKHKKDGIFMLSAWPRDRVEE